MLVIKLWLDHSLNFGADNFDDDFTEGPGDEEEDFEDEKNYANKLGLKGKVTISDIEKGYREIIKKYHPDKVAMMGDELKDLAEKRTKEINEAYEYFKKMYS